MKTRRISSAVALRITTQRAEKNRDNLAEQTAQLAHAGVHASFKNSRSRRDFRRGGLTRHHETALAVRCVW